MDFISFTRMHGLLIDRLKQFEIARCRTDGSKSKMNGAYYFAGDFGWCMDWSEHESPIFWRAEGVNDDPTFKQKVKQSQEKFQEERKKAASDAAKKAKWILGQCRHDPSFYLKNKGFPDMRGNVWIKDGADFLVIPMYLNGEIVGCQLISSDGGKRFIKGQITKGAFFQMGVGDVLFYVEGYASGLSLQRILRNLKISNRIIICFSASNMLYLAKKNNGFVIADNDESGTGEKFAIESGRPFWMPPVVGFDINDYEKKFGIFRVSQEIKQFIYASQR